MELSKNIGIKYQEELLHLQGPGKAVPFKNLFPISGIILEIYIL